MRTLDTIVKLSEIATYQKGLFTTAQANQAGIERYTLSRLESSGVIERLANGVYRMTSAPSPREEDVFAIWLSLNTHRAPGVYDPLNTPVATGVTAAWLHDIGEYLPTPYEFCCAQRRQTQRLGIVVRKRTLTADDVILIAGIPTTTAARTILDLIDTGEDLTLVATCLSDALRTGKIDDEDSLAAQINLRASKRGFPKNTDLYALMQEEKNGI